MSTIARLNASILVVDDDHDTRELLRFLLEQHVTTVVTADSVEAALESYRASAPDVVITDIGLPGYNGYALIALIRAYDKESGKVTPIIALTGYASPADRKTALAAGFDSYLEKPFDPAELLAAVVTLLSKTSKTT